MSLLRPSGTAVLKDVDEMVVTFTRLETRTKESNICASVWVLNSDARNESECSFGELRWESVAGQEAPSTDRDCFGERFEFEHTCWDPKDGELCLNRVKPGETLVEARSGSDVQIDRLKFGYRGERLIEPSSSWFPPKFPLG